MFIFHMLTTINKKHHEVNSIFGSQISRKLNKFIFVSENLNAFFGPDLMIIIQREQHNVHFESTDEIQ